MFFFFNLHVKNNAEDFKTVRFCISIFLVRGGQGGVCGPFWPTRAYEMVHWEFLNETLVSQQTKNLKRAFFGPRVFSKLIFKLWTGSLKNQMVQLANTFFSFNVYLIIFLQIRCLGSHWIYFRMSLYYVF